MKEHETSHIVKFDSVVSTFCLDMCLEAIGSQWRCVKGSNTTHLSKW